MGRHMVDNQMDNVSANQEEIDMKLTQMGAEVTSLYGIISFIRFHFDQIELFYVYNVNSKNQYYLQMVKPYPVGAGVFSNLQEMVQYIDEDIQQFQNASNSHAFQAFVTTNQDLYQVIQKFKDVYMSRNVPKEKIQRIREMTGGLYDFLTEIEKTSSPLQEK